VSDLQELYQAVILDHNRAPRNYGALDGATRTADGRNPLCGDEVHVALRVAGEVIEEVRFTGRGCAISKASASLMTSAVKGKSVAEAEALFRRFHALVTGQGGAEGAGDLGPLVVFSGVSRFPARVKCASLPWHALRAALAADDGDGGAPAHASATTE
jgi:nitrogen fixation NifU-like protein